MLNYPLSDIQKGILFGSRFKKNNPYVYLNQVEISFKEFVNVNQLKQAIQQTIIEFPILNAQIFPNQFKLVINNDLNLDFNITRLEITESRNGLLQKTKEIELMKGVDISKPPLIRFLLIEIAEDDYVLLITYHHILMAGRCVMDMLQRLITLYDEPNEISSVSIPRNIINEELSETIKKINFDELVQYYQSNLNDIQKCSSIGNVENFDIALPKEFLKIFEAPIFNEIKNYCKTHKITLPIFLSLTWGILQSWFNVSNKILFGLTKEMPPQSNKFNCGFGINTIPVVMDIHNKSTIDTLIGSLKDQARLSKKGVFFSLKNVKSFTKIPNDMPLFEIVLDYKPLSANDFMSKKNYSWDKKQRYVKFDFFTDYPVFIEVFQEKERLHLKVTYHSGYDEAFIQQLFFLYTSIVESILKASKETLIYSCLEKITQTTGSIFFVKGKDVPIDLKSNFWDFFERHVLNNGTKPAIIYNDYTISFHELNTVIEKISDILIHQYSMKAGQSVLIQSQRHLLYAPMILALLRLKVTFAPFDSNIPAQNHEHILKEINPNYVIEFETTDFTNKHCCPVFKEFEFILLQRHLETHTNSNENIAYVLFTSGTTGTPKGVRINYSALENVLSALQDQIKPQPEDCFLSISAFTFDISYLELLMPLRAGIACIIATEEQKRDPNQLEKIIKDKKVTLIQGTPTFFNSYLRSNHLPDCVKQIIVGGEALTNVLAEKLWCYPIKLWNAYGPTETTIWSSLQEVKRDDLTREIISIGSPIDNTIIGILGISNVWLPLNSIGEICIGGRGLFEGYLNDKNKTDNRLFIYSDINSVYTKFYKTGDLGFLDIHHKLHYIERMDEQLKIHGHRIEIAHIEHELNTINGLDLVAVKCFYHESQPCLVAYYTLIEDIHETFIKKEVEKKLPHYMRPFFYVKLRELPISTSGKIDKNKLEKPLELSDEIEINSPDADFLRYTWAIILGIEKSQVHMNSHFFLLGGNSIDALKVSNRINEFYYLDSEVKDLFDYPILQNFYHHISNLRKHNTKNNNESFNIHKIEKKSYPLSFQQERLWSFQKIYSTSSAYNMFVCFELNGDLDEALVKKAIRFLVKKHSALRTTYPMIEGAIQQVIHNGHNLYDTIFSYEEKSPDIDIKNTIKIFSEHVFDLEIELPILTQLISISPKVHYLLINIHHIACDGWSIALLLNDLNTYINTNAPSNSFNSRNETTKEIEYKDYSFWQRTQETKSILEVKADFWGSYLAGSQPLLLPQKRVAELNQTKGKRIGFEIDENLFIKIKESIIKEHTTPFLLLLSAFAALMHRYTLQDNFFITVPVSGRQHPQLENIVGFFVNLLPLIFNVNSETTLRTLLPNTKNNLFEIIRNQDVPFNTIKDSLSKNITNQNIVYADPLLQVLFVMQDTYDSNLNIPSVTSQRAFSDNETLLLSDFDSSKFNLTLFLQESENSFNGLVEFSEDLFSTSFVESLIENYKIFLTQLLEQIDCRLSEVHFTKTKFDSMSKWVHEDPKNLINEWNKIQKQQKNKIAISDPEKTLTYFDMDKLSDLVATYILSSSSKNSIVAIYVKKPINFIVAMLAILKANCTYLPIDFSSPNSRIKNILNDAEANLILTDETNSARELQKYFINIEALPEITSTIMSTKLTNPLAYVIYTSGTTSMPKGVCISHNNVCALLKATQPLFTLNSNDKWCLLHSVAFDFSVWEIWGALIYGATLYIPPKDIVMDPKKFISFLIESEISILNLTPGVLGIVIEELNQAPVLAEQLSKHLRHIILGGDSIENLSLSSWFTLPISNTTTLYNLYGITEATVHTTFHKISKDDISCANQNNIGQGLSHTQIFVADLQGHLLPNHIVGELIIGGLGVAKGYLSSQEKNPFISSLNEDHEISFFRTGDLVRRWENGDFEYIGRRDKQVNLRGYRIGLNEIIDVMKRHESVQHAFAFISKENKQLQLHLYLTFNEEYLKKNKVNIIRHWQKLYDDIYQHPAQSKILNTSGWVSSYSQTPYSNNEMQEWLNHTLEKINSHAAENVIEIGCGTGMILFQLIHSINSYKALDISNTALKYIDEQLTPIERNKCQLFNKAAHKIDFFELGSCDLLICNSVIQYFYSGDYLINCISKWLDLVQLNGTIFLGDIRSLCHQKYFYRKVALMRGIELEKLSEFINAKVDSEEELLIHHQFFLDLPKIFNKINYVKIELKFGEFETEMNDFRYDVTIGVEKNPPKSFIKIKWDKWDGKSIEEKLQNLIQNQNDYLALKEVPNAAFNDPYLESTLGNVKINQWSQNANKFGLKMIVQFSNENTQDCFDVIFYHKNFEEELNSIFFCAPDPQVVAINTSTYFNTPKNYNVPLLFDHVIEYMKANLPAYMLPNKVFYLDHLPLTQNGKLDHESMVKEGKLITRRLNSMVQLNKTESQIANIWSIILDVAIQDKYDDFFELGGNSLQAIQMISEVERQLSIEISIKDFYTNSSLYHFSKMVEEISLTNSIRKYGVEYEKISNSPLILLRKGNSMPLFLFHPIGGSAFPYLDMIKYLNPKQTVYAIQDPAIDEGNLTCHSLEKLVAYYLTYIQKIQNEGPYYFAGSSLGGTLAYEAAFQIKHRAKQQVFVAMFDSWALYTEKLSDKERLEQGIMRQYDIVKEKLNNIPLKDPKIWLTLHYERLKQVVQYKPPMTSQNVVLYKSEMLRPEFLEIDDISNHWKTYTKGIVETIYIPGDHETIMLNENVKYLAGSLNEKIKEFESHSKSTVF